jgi:sorbitol-specific phosphotransferase system component IIBC
VGLVVVIVLLGAYLTSRNSVCLSLENLRNIAEQSTYLGLLAVAMTFDEPAWLGEPVTGSPRRWAQVRGTVVSTKAACSGTSKRATPAAFVVIVPTTEFLPSPLAFQSASVNRVEAGSPPML